MATPIGNAVIGQSGGPTSVINQSLIGVVQRGSDEIEVFVGIALRPGEYKDPV